MKLHGCSFEQDAAQRAASSNRPIVAAFTGCELKARPLCRLAINS
jgi:hypothetical protein